MPKKEIVLDSNFLMVLSRTGLSETLPLKSLLARYNTVVPKAIVRELERLAGGKSSKAKNARLALEVARKCKVIDEDIEQSADDAVLKVALKRNATVATLDQELIASLRRMDIPVVTLRKNRLEGLDA
jgi:rRNA-processing protein FCF1